MKKKSFSPYKAPFWAVNGHISTIIPTIFRKQPEFDYDKEPFHFTDGDLTQLNWLKKGCKKLVIIIPGMGSNASKNYITNTAHYLHKQHYDILVPDHRGIALPNKLIKTTHSANYEDLSEIIQSDQVQGYQNIYLIGYSLGGSIALNYIKRFPTEVTKTVTISAPIELENASHALEERENFLYQRRFVKNLRTSLLPKTSRFPSQLPLNSLKECQTVKDIDELYTAPINGFRNAEEYYEYGSASNFIDKISSPLLIISAKDDPFIPLGSETVNKMKQNANIHSLLTNKGGHVAYPSYNLRGVFWHEKQVLKFIRQ